MQPLKVLNLTGKEYSHEQLSVNKKEKCITIVNYKLTLVAISNTQKFQINNQFLKVINNLAKSSNNMIVVIKINEFFIK